MAGQHPLNRSDPLHVLVVDDYPDVARSLAEFLSAASGRRLTTDIAFNGAQALMQAATKPPDVVVIDLEMPIMDGFEAAHAIRTSLFDAPPMMIAVCGSPPEPVADDTVPRPFDHMLPKPVNLEQLLAIIESL